MQKKSIFTILGVMLVVVVASLTMVFAVGPKVSADDEGPRIGTLQGWDMFEIEDYAGVKVLRGLSDKAWGYLGVYDEFGAWYEYDYVNVIIPDGINVIEGRDRWIPRSLEGEQFLRNGVIEELSVLSLEIPNSVVEISTCAFSNLNKLKVVNFAENSQLNTIGNYAFRGCDKLETITIPASVTTIGNNIFGDAGYDEENDEWYCYASTQINVQTESLYNDPNFDGYRHAGILHYVAPTQPENNGDENQNNENQNQENNTNQNNNETANSVVTSSANKINPVMAWIGGGIAAGLGLLGTAAIVVTKRRK